MDNAEQKIPAESLPIEGQVDPERERLRAAAIESDMHPDGEKPEADSAQPEVAQQDQGDKPQETQTDSSEPSAQRDPETGKFVSKEGEQQQEQQKPYPKVKKDQERFERNWQRLEAEKEAVRQREAQLAQAAAQMQQMGQQAQGPRFSSQHLWQAAQEFEKNARRLIKEGEYEQADSQIELADKARQAAQDSAMQEQYEAYQYQAMNHEQTWMSYASQVMQQFPEYQDPESEAAEQMIELLEQAPILQMLPDGFVLAHQLIQMRNANAEVSGLREAKQKLEKQLKELQERTGIDGSSPVPRSDGSFDNLPLAEQGRQLRQQLAAQERL